MQSPSWPPTTLAGSPAPRSTSPAALICSTLDVNATVASRWSDSHDQSAIDDDPVAPHRPQGAGSGTGVELASLATPAARAADLLPGSQRGLRDQDREGLERQ